MDHLINLAGFVLAYLAVALPVALGFGLLARGGKIRKTSD